VSDVLPDPEDPTQYLIADATDASFGAHQGVAVLENVHPATACDGRHCVIHNPSNHHMRSWPLVWRDDKWSVPDLVDTGLGCQVG
jgi:hypothetical protein